MKILEEKQHSFEDILKDPDVKVMVANSNKQTPKLKHVSELKEEAKEIVKETLKSTASINITATKP